MSGVPSPQEDRERLEKQLRADMQAAGEVYLAAFEEYAKIKDEFSNMLDQPDGAHAVNEAFKKKEVALENYARAVRAFTDLTLRGRHPIPGDTKS